MTDYNHKTNVRASGRVTARAHGIDGHTADPRLPWPRCFGHINDTPYFLCRQCSDFTACVSETVSPENALLSLKHYQQPGSAPQPTIRP